MNVFQNAFKTLFPTAAFAVVSIFLSTTQAQEADSSFVLEGVVEMEEAPAQPDAVAIPRFEDGVAIAQPLVAEEVEAVEIPAELMESKPEITEEKIEVEADVEEKVARTESIIELMKNVPVSGRPTTAQDLRAKSSPTRSGQLGSSVLTRTEARTFTFKIPAPRGQILDRNGYPLAQSKVVHYAAISFPFLGSEVKDEEIARYAGERVLHVNNILGATWDMSDKRAVEHYRNRRWVPLRFSSVLTAEEVDELRRQKMEGLMLHPVYMRHYPQAEALSHVIGYVGKRPPNPRGEIVNGEPLWGEGEGVDGLEKAFDPDLRGTPGRINVLFEADGTKVKEDVLSRPKPGYNVVTSIDLEMQRLCERLLSEKVKRGAMVIMDVRNGDVMAMASFPQFDPNVFIPAISQENYTALIEDPAKPLFPRAFRAGYPPASTFKVATALGFLESGYISPHDVYPCPASWTISNLTMRNWNAKGEGSMNVVGALTRSCNTWFYEVAISAGGDSMSYMASRLGLGEKTGIPLNEAEGFVPNNRWWLDQYGHMMSDGDEAVMSIGQGKVETTPLQVARMMAAVGNGDQVLKPRLVLQIQDLNHEIERTYPVDVANNLNVDSYNLKAVQRGMYDVVNAGNGTGKAAYHKITVSGKTGTGQWKPAQKQNIAWFAGYFPSKFPVYSFAVIYEGDPGESVGGGKNAAPVVGAFLEEYLTEENYNKVRERSNELKGEVEESGVEEYSYREPIKSIFRSSDAGAEGVIQEVVPQPTEVQGRPRSNNGGFFEKIFKRKRR
ncbi:penicillin-binding transpeptidase domain-containing protein [Verrucomicrobiales bacterium BCK34]|nr:penicillin-binding transpeptidase domain-containing protein [Verrucomicrobiales bacterium BCK34]